MSATTHQLPGLMGVLNVTPDSFSDGGSYTAVENAIAQAKVMIAEGATIIDVGGESTRPGATRLDPSVEQQRVLPVIGALRALPQIVSGEVRISIDTLNASTALAACAAGARLINDVSGGLLDYGMFEAAAQTGATYILGHWANPAEGSGSVQDTKNIAGAVVNHLADRMALAEASGVHRDQLMIDPGLGFGKSGTQNWQLLQAFDQLAALELPVVIGASRKRFLTEALLNDAYLPEGSAALAREPIENAHRDAATAVLSATFWAGLSSETAKALWGFRVHNVRANRDALLVASALRFANRPNAQQS